MTIIRDYRFDPNERLLGKFDEKRKYQLLKSQQKDFYTFAGTGDHGNEVSLKIEVEGFLTSNKIILNQKTLSGKESNVVDVDIEDLSG